MLDQAIKDQLKEVFSKLDQSIELVMDASDHNKQAELAGMLGDLAEVSAKISLVESGQSSPTPRFHLRHKGAHNGVSFVGIPGGHEFTSLVLAILNSNGKAKLPDQQIIQRLTRLKGPIRLRTFISLSCENCPEVVQALNLMAIFHNDIEHQMVDGGMCPEEVESLKIQGVPAVVTEDGKLLSSGKASLIELLKKVEEHYGTEASNVTEPVELGQYDVVVIGGGPAGASAAIYTARKGLRTALIAEKMGGQVQDTKGIENFISVPYTEGPKLAAHLSAHLAAYDVQILEHRRVKTISNEGLKFLELDSGETLTTKSLIVATGAKWRELGVPGEKEYLGQGVAFCPHCDGPFYKGKDIAVVGGGNSGVEAAIDLSGIVKSVTLFEFSPELKADDVLVKKLKSLSNVKIITNARTSEIIGDGQKVTALEYEDRSSQVYKKVELAGVFVQIGLIPNSSFLKGLVETNAYGEILIDGKCRTSVPGVYAAGDVTTVAFKQIVVAMGEGAKAALTAFEEQTMGTHEAATA